MTDSIDSILEQYSKAGRDALIPILQKVQDAEGFLSRNAVKQISRRLGLPASKIYGVATFYNQFRFQPNGTYHIQVCRGTACHVKGSRSLLDLIERELGIKPDETSRDGLFSLEIVACIGACGLAPAICVNGEVHAKVTNKAIGKIIKTYRAQGGEGAGQ